MVVGNFSLVYSYNKRNMSRAPQTFCAMNSIVSARKMIFQYISFFIYFTFVLSEECYLYDTKSYNGIYNVTKTGYSCQRWDLATVNFTVTDSDFRLDGSVQDANNYCRDPFKKGFLWCPSTNPDYEAERCNIKECGRETYFLVADGLDMKRCRLVTDENMVCNADEVFSCENVTSTIENTGECTCCSRRGCLETSSDMYEGKWHHSEDGKECQPWAASVPNLEVKKLGAANNYCRDPFNLGYTVCFTEGTGIRVNIAPCSIPLCSEIASRHNYDHDCYTPTDKDRSHPSLPDSPTPEQLCELKPERFFMESPSDDYPGCKNCSCCQIKECYRGPAYKYNGTWSRTVGGRLCSKWGDHLEGFDNYPTHLLESENYCRSFFGDGLTYCKTYDPDVPIEECDLQSTCDEATNKTFIEVLQAWTMYSKFPEFTQEADVEYTSSATEAFTETIITESTSSLACQKEKDAGLLLVIMVLIHSNQQLYFTNL